MNTNMKRVALPTKGGDERVQKAVAEIIAQSIGIPLVVTDNQLLQIEGAEIVLASTVDVSAYQKIDGLDPVLVAAAALVDQGRIDTIVAGADFSSEAVFMAYLRVIGVSDAVDRVVSYFLMTHADGRRHIYLDCALDQFAKLHDRAEADTVEERAEILAYLGEVGAEAARQFGIEPRVGFGSFATGLSSGNILTQKVARAAELFQAKHPDIPSVGPIQFDAMVNVGIAETKLPEGQLQGDTKVFVFPGIDAGNMGYKEAQELGGFTAIGPLFHGFKKPAHDLSRGCSVADIIAVVKVAVSQCQ